MDEDGKLMSSIMPKPLSLPTSVTPSSCGFTSPGSKEGNSLLNQGFLQAKPEKVVAAQKTRSHIPTPAPVSAVNRSHCPPFHPQGLTCEFLWLLASLT